MLYHNFGKIDLANSLFIIASSKNVKRACVLNC